MEIIFSEEPLTIKISSLLSIGLTIVAIQLLVY